MASTVWMQRWRALSISIEALREGIGPFLASNDLITGDGGASYFAVLPEIEAIIADIRSFHADFKNMLPPAAEKALGKWAHTVSHPQLAKNAIKKDTLASAIALLGVVHAAMGRHLADNEVVGRSAAERAFLHLQRSIVADPEFKRRWQAAFADGETSCESLGDIHLLSQGVWAFKAHGAGERTDLVFKEPLSDDDVQRSAPAAIVLTEWKVAKPDDEARLKLSEAKAQATIYAGSLLADFELRRTRYLVVVTSKRVDLPDTVDGDVTYRAINIAVDPDSPSVHAKKTSATGGAPVSGAIP